ncbi:MAG TPA: PfkB family carbohydrate kinase [Acidobacteriota bacterium]|nr:PfkB family carbohydrate kinase [Acidobacteriota bacterium]
MPEILAVGSVAYDSVETPFGKVDRALGGSATYFSVSASFFTKVLLVGCVGQDFEEEHIEMLESKDIDLEGLQVVDGDTFFWAGQYGYDLNEAHTLDTQLNVFADFHPELPESYRDAQYIFLGNIDPVLQREVLSQVKEPKLVACDTMNYWIKDHLDSLRQTVSQINVLIINDAETRQLANESNIVRAARRILEWGPHTLVIKRGEYGVLMFRRDPEADNGVSAFAVPGYPLEEIFDPTGAGDSFAGGFLGYLAGSDRIDTGALRQAIIFGSVMASFNVERFSLERLSQLTFTEVGLRYKEFRRLTHFEDVD